MDYMKSLQDEVATLNPVTFDKIKLCLITLILSETQSMKSNKPEKGKYSITVDMISPHIREFYFLPAIFNGNFHVSKI